MTALTLPGLAPEAQLLMRSCGTTLATGPRIPQETTALRPYMLHRATQIHLATPTCATSGRARAAASSARTARAACCATLIAVTSLARPGPGIIKTSINTVTTHGPAGCFTPPSARRFRNQCRPATTLGRCGYGSILKARKGITAHRWRRLREYRCSRRREVGARVDGMICRPPAAALASRRVRSSQLPSAETQAATVPACALRTGQPGATHEETPKPSAPCAPSPAPATAATTGVPDRRGILSSPQPWGASAILDGTLAHGNTGAVQAASRLPAAHDLRFRLSEPVIQNDGSLDCAQKSGSRGFARSLAFDAWRGLHSSVQTCRLCGKPQHPARHSPHYARSETVRHPGPASFTHHALGLEERSGLSEISSYCIASSHNSSIIARAGFA